VKKRPMRFFRNNGLSLVLFGLFVSFLGAQSLVGWRTHNDDQREHGKPELSYVEFATGPEFGETVFENWESEFLQMGAFVLFTVFLRQKGSAESKDPDGGKEEVDADPASSRRPDSPWPVRHGGVVMKIYSHSLGLTFVLLFALSFFLHAATGARAYTDEQLAHGGAPVGTLAYMTTSRFWYESFQNWQSEFLAVAAMVVLSIFLRERGSSESKPVAEPHHSTGK
jgi:hypothetical protein